MGHALLPALLEGLVNGGAVSVVLAGDLGKDEPGVFSSKLWVRARAMMPAFWWQKGQVPAVDFRILGKGIGFVISMEVSVRLLGVPVGCLRCPLS